MMIDQLTDQEKSVLLARAMGWQIRNSDRIKGLQFVYDDSGTQIHVSRDEPFMTQDPFDLYNPAHMALAWLVLNWAATWATVDYLYEFWEVNFLIGIKAAEAQRRFLDKILELAIEAGLVAKEERG